MVPSRRIELSTSPLPRVRSTTELRRPEIFLQGAISCLYLQGFHEKYMICKKIETMTKKKNSYLEKNNDRLASALRENLLKRKQQAKAKKKTQPEEKKD